MRQRDRAFISYWPVPGDSGKFRLAVKDVIDMKGKVTTAGSEYLAKNSPPARQDAALLRGARRPDVAIVGKTNLTEFALGTTGANEFYGTPMNPIDRHRIPGGSSSGSAVAVANEEADVAFGSDGGFGPGSCCVLRHSGLEDYVWVGPPQRCLPAFSEVPRHHRSDGDGRAKSGQGNGVVGCRIFDSLRNGQGKSALPEANQDRTTICSGNGFENRGRDRRCAEGLRISGCPPGRRFPRSMGSGAIEREHNRDHGWLVERSPVSRQTGSRPNDSGHNSIGSIAIQYCLQGALKARRSWRRELRRVFDKVDYIALPTLKSLPPHKLLFERSAIFEARVLGLHTLDAVATDFAGNPATAIPIPYPDRHFPVTSLQLIGPNFSEGGLVNVARLITEKAPLALEKHSR